MRIVDDDGLTYELPSEDLRAMRIRTILRTPSPKQPLSPDKRLAAVLAETSPDTIRHIALIATRGSISQVDLEREMQISAELLRGRGIALSKRCKKWGVDYFIKSAGFARDNRRYTISPEVAPSISKWIGDREFRTTLERRKREAPWRRG